MIQLKNDSIRQAAANTASRYDIVNSYAQNEYKRLDDFMTAAQNDYNSAYDRAIAASGRLTQATVDGLGLQKSDAYDTYEQNRAAANQGYQKYANYNGAFGSKMIESGLSGSGYEQVVKARAFSQKQAQLAAANTELQKQLTQIDGQIAQAKAAGDDAQAQYYLQRAQQIADLQGKVSDSLSSISSQIYNMNTAERNYEYQAQQDRIAREQQERQLALSAESNRLAREKWEYDKQTAKDRQDYKEKLDKYEKRIAELEAKLNQASRIPPPNFGLDFSWATKK